MKRALLLGLTVLFLTVWTPPLGATEVDEALLQEDLEQMLTWFAGRFDNHWQHREEEAAEEPVEHPHGRIHSIFAPVDLPAVGEHIFYVQQYSSGDPSKVYRQRLYRFHADAASNSVVLTIFAPPDVEAVLDAHLDPSKLEGLTLENLTMYEGCEVYWQRQNRGGEDDHFVGKTKEGACRVESRRSGRTLIISDDLRLDAGQIWIQDRAVDTEGNWVYGNQAGIPHKLWKARPFTCWAAEKKPEDEVVEGESAWHGWRGLEIHDQGGSAEMLHEGSSEAKYSFEVFQAIYRGATEVPVLELAVKEKGQEKSIAYAWTSPDAARIGINLRFLQVGCTLNDE